MNAAELGQHIRERRKLLGINQSDVAELAEVSVHTLSNIESGKGNPTLDVVESILSVLGLTLRVEVAS